MCLCIYTKAKKTLQGKEKTWSFSLVTDNSCRLYNSAYLLKGQLQSLQREETKPVRDLRRRQRIVCTVLHFSSVINNI